MNITVKEIKETKEEQTIEQLLQAGSCGAGSGGCEYPPLGKE